MRACAAAGTSIVPQGGNTALVGGGVPDDSGDQVLLSLKRLNRVRNIDAANLTLAFRLDRTFEAVAVQLKEQDGEITGEVAGTTDREAAKKQVARMLGLDADAAAWLALGKKDR